MAEMSEQQQVKAVNVSALIASLSEKAVRKISTLMDKGGSEAIQLAAAKDLLDRNPETSKTQKVQVDDLTIMNQDAKLLAAAMVEAARLRNNLGDSPTRDTLAIAGLNAKDEVASPTLKTE